MKIEGLSQKHSRKAIIEAAAHCLFEAWWHCLQHGDDAMLDVLGVPKGDTLTRCNKLYDMYSTLKAIAASI